MPDRVRTWERLQRLETRLVRAGARVRPELSRRHLADFDVAAAPAGLLVRVGSGLDPAGFTAGQYHARYPFSPEPEIERSFDGMVEAGLCERTGAGYRLSERGAAAVRAWIGNVGEMIRSGQPAIDDRDAARLLWFDRETLTAMAAATRPHARLAFELRRRGLQPDYRDRELWHHWQLVWTMIALHEDEEEHVRRQVGLAPLPWFLRRNLWLIERRPWLARAATVGDLATRMTGYSPVPDPQSAVMKALAELDGAGWIEQRDGGPRLTARGLAATDTDERLVDEGFLSSWPAFDDNTWRELDDLLDRIGRPLEGLAG